MRDRELGDLLEVIIDHRGKTPKKLGGVDFTDAGVPVISAIHIKNGRINWNERRRYVPQGMFERWMPVRLRAGDVLLTSEAPLGEVAQVENDGDLVLSQRLFALRGKRGLLDSTYLRYFLQSSEGQRRLLHRASGTTVFGIRQAELIRVKVPVPPIEEQQRIAGVLSALDDLIDINRRLARQLDSRLVASWVALARRCHMERVLGELVELRKGVSYKGTFLAEQGLPLINLANFALDGSFKESGTKHYLGPVKDRQLLSKGSLVVANTDLTQRCEILARPLLVPFEAATSTHHTFQVDVRGSDARRGWIFCALRTEVIRKRLISFATGTTVAALPADALLSQEIPLASDQVIDGWWSKASVLREAQESVAAETHDLVGGRDELLPLLMSGRVRVEDMSV